MTDYISREAALDFHIQTYDLNISVQDERILGDRFEEFLKSIPAADVRPVVRARWEDETGYIFSVLAQRVYCPACKSYAYFYPQKTKNFCPNCGADMREG